MNNNIIDLYDPRKGSKIRNSGTKGYYMKNYAKEEKGSIWIQGRKHI